MITVPITVAESTQHVSLSVAENIESFAVGLATAIQIVTGEHYHGTSEVTPCDHDVVLETAGLFMDEPITIHAIPDNYGLITWDGRTITVS